MIFINGMQNFPASLMQNFPAFPLQKFPASPSLLFLQSDCQFSGLEFINCRLKNIIQGNVFNEEMDYNNKSAQCI